MQRYFFLPLVNSGFCFSSKAHGRREVIWSRLTEAVPRSMFIGHPKWQSVRYQALDRNWLMFPLLVKEKIPYENWPLEKRPVKSQKKRSEPWSAEMTISETVSLLPTLQADLSTWLRCPPCTLPCNLCVTTHHGMTLPRNTTPNEFSTQLEIHQLNPGCNSIVSLIRK